MRYGLYLPNFGAFGDPRTLVSFAVEAEAQGWEGFFIWDHIAGFDNTMVDPWVALAAAAQATRRILIGTTVTPVPRRRPQKLARETASLDRLSNGRLIFGVGIGDGAGEYDNLGEEPGLAERGEMLDEALEVITKLWTGERVDHRGKHYRIEGARFRPTPVQTPRIPVWVGGIWPNRKPMRRAARWDGVIPLFDTRDDDERVRLLRECADYVRAHRGDSEPFDVVWTGISPGDDVERATDIVSRYAEAGVTWWLESIAPYRFDRSFDEPWDVEALRERVMQGPPRID